MSVNPLSKNAPVELNICTLTFANGADVAAFVTVPPMRPPSASAKFIPDVVEPTVTAIGVPVVTLQLTHVMLL